MALLRLLPIGVLYASKSWVLIPCGDGVAAWQSHLYFLVLVSDKPESQHFVTVTKSYLLLALLNN